MTLQLIFFFSDSDCPTVAIGESFALTAIPAVQAGDADVSVPHVFTFALSVSR